VFGEYALLLVGWHSSKDWRSGGMDIPCEVAENPVMNVPPETVVRWPVRGDIIVGRDVAGRILRINGHPRSDRVVLSVWQGPRCVATVRLASSDVPEVVAALLRSVLPSTSDAVPTPESIPASSASVTRLRTAADTTIPLLAEPLGEDAAEEPVRAAMQAPEQLAGDGTGPPAADRLGLLWQRGRRRMSAAASRLAEWVGPPDPR
jgi:hypothetical protein